MSCSKAGVQRAIFGLICLVLSTTLAIARVLPLAAKDIGLMLRGGDSNATVMEQLAVRHFVGPFSLEDEQMLRKAGASEELIRQLSTGKYALPADQSAAAQQQIGVLAQKHAAEAARAEQLDAVYQAKIARERTAKPAALSKPSAVGDALKGSLVRLQNDDLVPVNDAAVAGKKLYALYFSAHWCGPCRKFTPQLVDYYNRTAAQHPEVEFVFVSADRSPDEMTNYMREAKMPWSAIEFSKVRGNGAINGYCGKGIPCLVLVDGDGRVVSNSYEGDKYVGPQKVLGDLDQIFGATGRGGVASVP